ncbi:MAG TPA: protein-tyrosine phosphatase family protein [Pseudonocardiaceae bacterium]|nr:protein-tyrosine phosphatase family protein [Pseudonocardiaceae bacterium]
MSSERLSGSIELPDATVIRGRGLRNPMPAGPLPEYGLYLGAAALRARHDASLTWPHDWLDWPDFRLPRDRAAAIAAIRALHQRALAGERVEVACNGGAGRTGTALSILAILAGVPSTEAVTWVRAHYSPRAVETPWQRRWVAHAFK